MDGLRHLKIEDLQKLCDEGQEETLTLEFKPCNELKIGTNFYDKTDKPRPRQRDDILDELTRDITAFLNSAGGTIIYGIQEKKSRADTLDTTNSFKPDNKQDNIQAEKITDWLRAHIQPPPTVNVYRVFENPNDPQSAWYLVVEIPQGQQAYMAKDHKFYKRIANSVKLMEQYEVADVMNRTRGAALDLRMEISKTQLRTSPAGWLELQLKFSITSTNFIGSEYGAIKFTFAYPFRLDWINNPQVFKEAQIEHNTGLVLVRQEYVPHAQSIMIRWGANKGSIIFPGDWFDFYGNGLPTHIPNLSVIQDPTYLLRVELFTMNSRSKEFLYSIRRQPASDNFELLIIDSLTYESFIESFWKTYHQAWKGLIPNNVNWYYGNDLTKDV